MVARSVTFMLAFSQACFYKEPLSQGLYVHTLFLHRSSVYDWCHNLCVIPLYLHLCDSHAFHACTATASIATPALTVDSTSQIYSCGGCSVGRLQETSIAIIAAVSAILAVLIPLSILIITVLVLSNLRLKVKLGRMKGTWWASLIGGRVSLH